MSKDFFQDEKLTREGNLLRESLMQKLAAMRAELIKYYTCLLYTSDAADE